MENCPYCDCSNADNGDFQGWYICPDCGQPVYDDGQNIYSVDDAPDGALTYNTQEPMLVDPLEQTVKALKSFKG